MIVHYEQEDQRKAEMIIPSHDGIETKLVFYKNHIDRPADTTHALFGFAHDTWHFISSCHQPAVSAEAVLG